LLCGPSWPGICDLFASDSLVLGLQQHTAIHSSLIFSFLFFFFFVFLGFYLRAFFTLSQFTALFCDGFLQDRVSKTICLGWLQTSNLLISASCIPRITGVCHQHLANIPYDLAYDFTYLIYKYYYHTCSLTMHPQRLYFS
jgi:hypothetical protein